MKRYNNKFVFFLTIILVLSFWSCKKINEDVTEPEEKFDRSLLQSLNQSASPLTSADPTLPDTELAPLADIGQALIVGLGEATHGTHEFFAMKHRLFRYLVENFDFRVFAFECDYGESIYLDRWINGGAGNIDSLMKKYMHFWTWMTIEVKALLEWMRQVNLARPEAERLHFIGVDCQFFNLQPDLLREYLQRVSPRHLAEMEPLLVRQEKIEDVNYEQKMTLVDDLESEYQAWADLKSEFTAFSSPREFEVARQLLRTLIQADRVQFEYSLEKPGYRDRFMAENTLQTRRNLSGGRGIAIWAHNVHIANDDYYNDRTGSMGYHLRNEIGEQYMIIGFSFSQGSFMAVWMDPENGEMGNLQMFSITTPPKADTVNDLFHSIDKKSFFLRLDRLTQGDPLQAWLVQGRWMLLIGATYNGIPGENYYYTSNVPRHFDILIHFDQTTSATQF
jgi:erythromycin esterase